MHRIMKYLSLLLLVILISSCKKNKSLRETDCYTHEQRLAVPKEICSTNQCTTYQEIWKKLFIERNGLTEDFFNKHIHINNSEAYDGQDGTIYSIGYYVKVDWATTTYYIDQFVIKISKENILFPAINIPRDIYLSENHIRTILEAEAFYSDMEKLSAAEKLKFKNTDAAL